MNTFKDLFGFDIFDSDSYVRLVIGPHAQGLLRPRDSLKPVARHEYHQSGDPYRGTITRHVDERGCEVAVQIAPGKWLRRDWISCAWPDGRVRRVDGEIEHGTVEYLQRAGLL